MLTVRIVYTSGMQRFRRLWPYVVLLALIMANIVIWVQRDNIIDWWRLRDYSPPTQIVELASTTTMTDYGKRLFYANHPQLEDRQTFNQQCADYNEETAVLGCFHGSRQGIHIYAVDDPRLHGVLQVTAAHETLHEAYERLSGKDRQHVNAMLEAYYNVGAVAQDIKDKLDSYKSQDADLVNEMHSIFGTELRELSPELEEYYKQYFLNRSQIVTYREAYQAEFTRRKMLVDRYDAELASLKTSIETNKAKLSAKISTLKAKEAQINQDIASQDQETYEASVRAYNTMVEAYNSELAETHKLINRYNEVVRQRNDIATQERELQEALDSRFAPSQKQ